MQPAQFVLDHRADLALTPEQIPFIESLVLAQVDSARVRGARRLAVAIAASRNISPSTLLAGASSWTGPVDEGAIKETARKQAEQSAEFLVDLARDRHAVGAVLTPSQVAVLVRIESADIMGPLGVRAVGVVAAPIVVSVTPSSGSADFPFFEY